MLLKKNNINIALSIFLLLHLFVWTLIPSISNNNLPLDTIEALAWGSNLDWGFSKHPPLSAFFVEFFFTIFGNKDWAYYFLSQIFVIFSFFVVFKFSENFFNNSYHSLISILLLEAIYFYNFTTPEFNVNVCQLPFWALSIFYLWKGFKTNKIYDWLLFGLFSALGILSKYLFIYLLLSIDIFFIYLIFKKKFNYKCFVSLITFLLTLVPHIIWLTNNDYSTISYALQRTGMDDKNLLDHFIHPLIFFSKQIIILIPFLIIFSIIISKFKARFNFKDTKLIFLLIINIIPILLMLATSLFMGIKIRTMWMTPFYLFFGVLIVYIFRTQINLKKLKFFLMAFMFLFFLSPATYLYVSISQTDKRTDYPGKEIAKQVEEVWNNKFNSKIAYVSGDEWTAGNLSYHLKSRPVWLGVGKKVNSEDMLSFVDVYENNIVEALSKVGYFRIYGSK